LKGVGGTYAEQNLAALKLDGRWVLYSMLGGPTMSETAAAKFLPTLLGKRITLMATTLRGRCKEYKTKLVNAFIEKALPLIEKDEVKVLVHQIFSNGLQDAQAAHDMMESNDSSGKIILTLQ
jgi:tumor protein p53-inducible protein 3